MEWLFWNRWPSFTRGKFPGGGRLSPNRLALFMELGVCWQELGFLSELRLCWQERKTTPRTVLSMSLLQEHWEIPFFFQRSLGANTATIFVRTFCLIHKTIFNIFCLDFSGGHMQFPITWKQLHLSRGSWWEGCEMTCQLLVGVPGGFSLGVAKGPAWHLAGRLEPVPRNEPLSCQLHPQEQ